MLNGLRRLRVAYILRFCFVRRLRPGGFCGTRGGQFFASLYSPRRSARIHAVPAIAKVSTVSLQFLWLWGSERSNGTHTSNPKSTNIMVSRRAARRAMRFAGRATDASENKTVVVTAQNI